MSFRQWRDLVAQLKYGQNQGHSVGEKIKIRIPEDSIRFG